MSHFPNVLASSGLILDQVQRSIQAEQVFCSIVTQMKFLPQFADQQALKTVHEENYETSYHRNTAAGNLLRMSMGDPDRMLVLMTVECLIESREHDKKAEIALRQITTSTPEDDLWLSAATRWHKQRKRHLKRAAGLLYTAIGPEVWQEGTALAE